VCSLSRMPVAATWPQHGESCRAVTDRCICTDRLRKLHYCIFPTVHVLLFRDVIMDVVQAGHAVGPGTAKSSFKLPLPNRQALNAKLT
jgi:hypothetical protein